MTLENKDCLEFLRGIPDNSVDLVLNDPPYFIGYDGGKGWDSQWSSEDEYLDWCREWSQECARVLKPNRMMVVWGTLKTDTFLRYKLEILNKIPDFHGQNEIIWSYNWGGRTKSNFARKHEYAWCYSKGKDFLFNADDVRVERKVPHDMNKQKKMRQKYIEDYEEKYGKIPTKAEIKNTSNEDEKKILEEKLETYNKKYKIYKKEKIDPVTKLPKGTIPTSVWEKNNHTTEKSYCNWHPTTKNVYLLQRIIKAYTNLGDTVLDCFSGSGSTAYACLESGRDFSGCEMDADYYEKSLKRLKKSSENKI
jgi:site-specific DNA-methyltransferase (adenine-specific)